MAQAMAKAFADMGINTTDRNDEITYLVQNMPAEVLRTLPNIRLSEIPLAINRGILRQFGNFFGLNVATFMHFLMAHYQSEQRLNAIKAHSAAMASQAPKTAPSAQQIKQNRISRIATAFYQYKTTGYYNDYGSLVFDNINAMGKIPFTPQQETGILQQARQNMINRYSRVSLYADERAGLRSTLNKIINGEAPNLILTEAKRITLFQLFDLLINQNTDILNWLHQ